jgi:hypothetical protein
VKKEALERKDANMGKFILLQDRKPGDQFVSNTSLSVFTEPAV